jgi:hypothetical protein
MSLIPQVSTLESATVETVIELVSDVQTVAEIELSSVLVIEDADVQIISDVQQGIPGERGTDGNSIVFAERSDVSAETVFYKAEAQTGSLDASPVWRICRITMNSDVPRKEWVNGSASFTNVWDNRLTYTYS